MTLSAAETTVSSYNRVYMSCYSSAGRERLTLSAAGNTVSFYDRVYMSRFSSVKQEFKLFKDKQFDLIAFNRKANK